MSTTTVSLELDRSLVDEAKRLAARRATDTQTILLQAIASYFDHGQAEETRWEKVFNALEGLLDDLSRSLRLVGRKALVLPLLGRFRSEVQTLWALSQSRSDNYRQGITLLEDAHRRLFSAELDEAKIAAFRYAVGLLRAQSDLTEEDLVALDDCFLEAGLDTVASVDVFLKHLGLTGEEVDVAWEGV